MLTYLYTVFGCFYAITTELRGHDGTHVAHEAWNICYVTFYRGNLLIPGLGPDFCPLHTIFLQGNYQTPPGEWQEVENSIAHPLPRG